MIIDPIVVEFDAEGWSFQASLSTDLNDSASDSVRVRQLDETSWQIDVPDLAGSYRLDLFGRGPRGDVAVLIEFELADA